MIILLKKSRMINLNPRLFASMSHRVRILFKCFLNHLNQLECCLEKRWRFVNRVNQITTIYFSQKSNNKYLCLGIIFNLGKNRNNGSEQLLGLGPSDNLLYLLKSLMIYEYIISGIFFFGLIDKGLQFQPLIIIHYKYK